MCSKGFLKILTKLSRTLTERSTPFSDSCLKFATFETAISFSMLQTEKLKKPCDTVVEVHLL